MDHFKRLCEQEGLRLVPYEPTLEELYRDGLHVTQLLGQPPEGVEDANWRDSWDGSMRGVIDYEIRQCVEELFSNPELYKKVFGKSN